MLAQLLTSEAFSFLFVFVRVGAAFMMLPGIGDSFVMPRLRLILALLVTALIVPALTPVLPAPPAMPLPLFVMVAGEVVIGLFLGLIGRFLMAALDVAGTIISFQMSLANALVFNPAMTMQGTLIGTFLTIIGLVLIFVTDLHHLLLMAVVESYSVFPPGALPAAGEMTDTLARFLAGSFEIGLAIAAPFVVVGLVFYLGLGLLNRLMPQVQIFFIAMPLQILLGMVLAALTVSAMMLFWLGRFQDSLIGILPG